MQYLLKLSDAEQRHMVVLTLPDDWTKQAALDVIFELFGSDEIDRLVEEGILSEGQVEDFNSLRSYIFDRDSEGLFIREDVDFQANNVPLNPDDKMSRAFVTAHKGDVEYRLCDLIVSRGDMPSSNGQTGSVQELARLMFLHQVSIGTHIDVTKDNPELTHVIEWAEKEGLIEIDVEKVSYKLTAKGKRTYDSYIEEAQSLVKRYDIFIDVDVDSTGSAHFDSGLGTDIRVAVFEVEGVDPFRARFLLGLNDGEWDKLENWESVIESEDWYREIFNPIENAPSVNYLGGEARLKHIIDQGKAKLRLESQYNNS